MKYIVRLLLPLFLVASACSKGENGSGEEKGSSFYTPKYGDPVYEMVNTSWRISSTQGISGMAIDKSTTITISDIAPEKEALDGKLGWDSAYRYIFLNGTASGIWYAESANNVHFAWFWGTIEERAAFLHNFGTALDIVEISSESMVLRQLMSTKNYVWWYSSVSTPYLKDPATSPYFSGNGSGGSSGGNSGGNSSSYEKPEIGLSDYSFTTSSLTVYYRIYNQDAAKVSSAKGYYGTSSASSPVSATVTGSMIIIRLTGLKKNTTYYVKCSATGPGGTTTSDVSRLVTGM